MPDLPPSDPGHDALSLDTFTDHVGGPVTLSQATLEDTSPIGEVTGVLRRAGSLNGDDTATARSFYLEIWAPGDPLPQATRRVHVPGLGSWSLFVCPYGTETGGTLYEVAFSRAPV